mmetsp:Transcript_20187/g.14895  ORF Transcript_20187/g.14895 Transcript_20187/m.14895 type:complete len:85 (+) Transcript_20187:765-1019(+)
MHRKPLALVEPNEQRFVVLNLFPTNYSKNTKLSSVVKFDKYSERKQPWEKVQAASPTYDAVDVEKYKFTRSHVPKIYSLRPKHH